MRWRFTEVLRAMTADPEGISEELVEAFVHDLERALARELARRGLSSRSPELLDLPGYARWERDALAELAHDCYLHHLARLRSLAAQLAVHPNVDGFVLLNVRHFVFERQRAHDPLGYRLYEILSAAVERLIDAGELTRVGAGGDGDQSGGRVRFAGTDEVSSAPAALERAARAFSDALAPTLFGNERSAPIADLATSALRALRDQGVGTFAPAALIDAWKRDARHRRTRLERGDPAAWAVEDAGEERLAWVPRIEPDLGIEERERFEKLARCVARRLAGDGDGAEAGELWRRLVAYAADEASGEPPSQRTLAAATGIARHRIPELLERARRAFVDCRSALGERLPVSQSPMGRKGGAD